VLKERKIYILKDEELRVEIIQLHCYDLKSLESDERTTLVLSNTRELDRVPNTKWSTLYTIPHGPC